MQTMRVDLQGRSSFCKYEVYVVTVKQILCVCYVLYSEDVTNGSGPVWIECACGCWLHEEWAEDCVVNENSKERFCLTCL